MTDAEVLARCAQICDRGRPWPGLQSDDSVVFRLRKIVSDDDAHEARYLLPALLEVVERRGLK